MLPVPEHRRRMRFSRFERSLSQRQAAAQIGIARDTYMRVEKGDAGSLGTRYLIANYYGLPIRDLFPELFEEEPVAC